jgi:hypothetical protein
MRDIPSTLQDLVLGRLDRMSQSRGGSSGCYAGGDPPRRSCRGGEPRYADASGRAGETGERGDLA